MNSFFVEQGANILTVVIIFLALLTLFSILGVNFNPVVNKSVEKVVTIESFGDAIDADGGCRKSSNPADIHDYCKSIKVKKNCTATSCCIYLNDKKCVAGNHRGPTYHTENGKDIDVDYYTHRNIDYQRTKSNSSN